jgi:hypothetical protein
MIAIVTGERQHNKDEYTESSTRHAPGKAHMPPELESLTPPRQKHAPVRVYAMSYQVLIFQILPLYIGI